MRSLLARSDLAESVMFKIGDFSKLVRVSIKTLRHYDRMGLLKPAWVDRFTSYRYYTLEQLPRLNRILALKDLGFSLEQIRRLLKDNLPAAELRGMMRIKHAELEQQLQAEQARLARVEARLRQIEREGVLPQYEVVLKTLPPQRVVGVRDLVPGYADISRLVDELRAHLQTQHIAPDAVGPYLAIYYDAEYRDQGVDVEAAAPLPRPLSETSRTIVHELPGVETMACVVHQGSYERLAEAYNALMSWVEANGYHVAGSNRDVYLQGPGPGLDMEHCVTEVQFPVKKKPVSVYKKEKGQVEPQIISKAAFTVVGMKYRGKNLNNEIAQMWGEFNPRMEEIKHKADPGGCYGVCSDTGPDGVFEYVAGFEVSRAADVPDGMVSWDVPAQKYAVFPCTLKTIHQAYQYAFETWLPQSGYQRGDGPDFELYGEEFEPNVEGADQLHIYVPIK